MMSQSPLIEPALALLGINEQRQIDRVSMPGLSTRVPTSPGKSRIFVENSRT